VLIVKYKHSRKDVQEVEFVIRFSLGLITKECVFLKAKSLVCPVILYCCYSLLAMRFLR